MSSAQDLDEAVFQLRKALVLAGSGLRATHPWFLEADRWKELLFALLVRATGLPEGRVRALTDCMMELGLLTVGELAALQPDGDTAHARRIVRLITEAGVNEDRARVSLTTMIEAARGLQQHYEGKIQLYLRRYGELMLREIGQTFAFTGLTQEEISDAFTYWLQNALSMPLSLMDDATQAFCAQNGLTALQLRDAADKIGVNFSYVDDLTRLYMTRIAPPASPGDGCPAEEGAGQAAGAVARPVAGREAAMGGAQP